MSRLPEHASGAARNDWHRIEIRHLAALAAVARESSFSGAADRLGYGQSAVSRQIGFLEKVIGCRLVERAARPHAVRITAAGGVLLDHADEIRDELRAAKGRIDVMRHGSARAAAFGVSSAFAGRVAARLHAVAVAGEGWSRVEQGPSCRLLRAVETGRLDGAFVRLPVTSGPFHAMELLSEPYVLAVPERCCGADLGVPTGAVAAHRHRRVRAHPRDARASRVGAVAVPGRASLRRADVRARRSRLGGDDRR